MAYHDYNTPQEGLTTRISIDHEQGGSHLVLIIHNAAPEPIVKAGTRVLQS